MAKPAFRQINRVIILFLISLFSGEKYYFHLPLPSLKKIYVTYRCRFHGF